MRYGLLFTDLAAVLIGAFGLYTTAVFVTGMDWAQVNASAIPLFYYGTLLFLIAMTALFLVPSLHQRMLRATFRVPGRILVVHLAWAWLILASTAFLGQTEDMRSALLLAPIVEHFWAVAAIVAVLLMLLLFPFGLAYGDLRAEHRARTAAQAAQAARVAVAHTAVPAVGEPAQPAAPRPTRGPLAYCLVLPLAGAALLGVWAMKFGDVMRSAEVDHVVSGMLLPGAGAVAALVYLQLLVSRLAYPHHRNPMLAGRPLNAAFLYLVSIPLLSLGCWIVIGLHGVPYGAMAAQGGEARVIAYEVKHVSTGRRSRGCVTFYVVDDPAPAPEDRGQSSICTLSDAVVARLSPGMVVMIEGGANRFGQRIERIGLPR